MSRGLIYGLVVLVVLAVTLVLPIRRGIQMNCDGGIYKRMMEVGLPFSFYKTTGQTGMICVSKDQSWDTASTSERLTSAFKGSFLVGDLIIAGAILLGGYRLLQPKRFVK